MSEATTNQVLSRIDALAATLGVTAQHLWTVLVRQGVVEGWYGLVAGVICASVVILIVRRVVRHEPDSCAYCEGAFVVVWMGVVGLSIFALVCLNQTKYLFNPEGYAANRIVMALSSQAAK